MARTSSNIEFVVIKLNREDKSKFETWAKNSVDDSQQLVSVLITSGYKVSISHDFENDCFIVAVTGKKNSAFNTNKCMTSRAGDHEEALMIALYKHFVLADGGDWATIATSLDTWG